MVTISESQRIVPQETLRNSLKGLPHDLFSELTVAENVKLWIPRRCLIVYSRNAVRYEVISSSSDELRTTTRKVSGFPERVPSEHYGVIQNIDFMILKALVYIYISHTIPHVGNTKTKLRKNSLHIYPTSKRLFYSEVQSCSIICISPSAPNTTVQSLWLGLCLLPPRPSTHLANLVSNLGVVCPKE